MKTKLSWWQLGIATLAVSAIGARVGRKPGKSERQSFEKFEQAAWAPPPWVFGPAWAANNFFLLSALNRIARSNHPDRRKLLYLQIPIWFIFFSFGYVYARKRSPVLAAGWTVADALLAAASFAISRRHDRKTSYHFLPLLGWTTYASSLAVYQAVKNDDPVLETEAIA
jgi:tryptophan-rich sensory protein